MKLPKVHFGNLLLIHQLKEKLSSNNVFVQQTNVRATSIIPIDMKLILTEII